ncbi:MAG: hypothetical protein GY868_12095 [Deltaproteobacteria bacterium]|nr:hypothetical protein [Deltaproteobacteria bacterium]
MDTIKSIRTRKTIRGFLDKAVSAELMREIIIDAHWAPSASNQQPWNFSVVTGDPLAALCSGISLAHKERKLSYDPSKGNVIPPEYVQRTRQLFKGLRPLISSLGDENRSFIESGSYRFYNAPVVIFMTMHNSMPAGKLMDIGMAAQNIMLSAHSRGLGTCAIALTLHYADVIKTALNITDEYDVVLSVAVGYTDEQFSINAFRSDRDAVEDFTTWVGF